MGHYKQRSQRQAICEQGDQDPPKIAPMTIACPSSTESAPHFRRPRLATKLGREGERAILRTVNAETQAAALEVLENGPIHRLSDPIDPSIPRVAAGCYTIWDSDGRFVYAGMAGRGKTASAIAAACTNPNAPVSGLRDRLRSHQNGRRSGDQFCV
jgi:hypothetical protein